MTTEKTIAEEMTAAGQAWALTSGEPSRSSGDVAVVREAIVGGKSLTFLSSDGNYFNRLKDGYCLDDIVERALSALARVEDELGRLNRECNQRFAQALEDGQAANDAIHARDRAIDEKHRAILERNNLRTELEAYRKDQEDAASTFSYPLPQPGSDMARLAAAHNLIKAERDEAREELERVKLMVSDTLKVKLAMKWKLDNLEAEHAALKAAQEPTGAEIANYREREAGLIKRAEASDRLTELLPAQNAKLREELVALRKDLRFGDADAQNLAALTEEQARTIDYLHRRLADKESPEAEDEEPTPAAPSGEGDLEDAADLLSEIGAEYGGAFTSKMCFLAAERLRSHRCSPAPVPEGALGEVVKEMREMFAGAMDLPQIEPVKRWASTIEAHQCGGERDETASQLVKANGDLGEALIEARAALSASQARVAELEVDVNKILDWGPSDAGTIVFDNLREADAKVSELEAEVERLKSREIDLMNERNHAKADLESRLRSPQGSREAGELADQIMRCHHDESCDFFQSDDPQDCNCDSRDLATKVRALGAAPQGEAGTSAIGMCPLCAGPPYFQQQSDGHAGCSNHTCKLVGARITREAWGELSRKVYLDPEHQGGQS